MKNKRIITRNVLFIEASQNYFCDVTDEPERLFPTTDGVCRVHPKPHETRSSGAIDEPDRLNPSTDGVCRNGPK